MKFREPLELTCPVCEHRFERRLEWMLQNGQQCPKCQASLAPIRGELEGEITDWRHFVEDASRIMAVEDEFRISIPDTEAEILRTFDDALNYLIRRLGPNSSAELIWQRLCSAVAASEYGAVANPSRDDPFVRTVFSLKAK